MVVVVVMTWRIGTQGPVRGMQQPSRSNRSREQEEEQAVHLASAWLGWWGCTLEEGLIRRHVQVGEVQRKMR
jgi:hypothetical protein